jgi:arylsulfatase
MRLRIYCLTTAAFCVATPILAQQGAQRLPASAREVLPIAPAPFAGKIAPEAANATPAWSPAVEAPASAPNVLLIMTDDVGFGASSTFGGPVPTPNLDRLAQRGLRYNNFNTTAICSPSRAALLTGRNPHQVGTGSLVDLAMGFPGYNGIIPPSAATIAQILRLNGYNTAQFGKHHNVPYQDRSAAGPFDLWPTGLGFEYFFGFVGGDAHQYMPHLYRGTTQIDDSEAKGKLLDVRLADEAIGWIHNQKAAAPDKPFFAYIAPGSLHAPHQAPQDWIARFSGKFDTGWDALRTESYKRQQMMGVIPADAALTGRPAEIPSWASLDPATRKVEARSMEVAAAMLAYQDAQIGRVIDELDRMGILDNTLVVFIEGDNGASAESGTEGTANEIGQLTNKTEDGTASLTRQIDQLGSAETYSNYSAGWAWALDCPFRWTKQIASHLGGIRNGLVISWPDRIKQTGAVRSQFAHINDVTPTILDAAGIPAPKMVLGTPQQPMDGVSLAYSFDDAKAPERHRDQYFEIDGAIGYYHEGWFLSTAVNRLPWQNMPRFPTTTWELYDLKSDFSQAHDLAASNPAKLAEMKALWDATAKRNNVYPIDERFGAARTMSGLAPLRKQLSRTNFTYWGADTSVDPWAAPSFAARSFTIDADIDVPKGGGSGVIVANGSAFGGWSFYLDKGRPVAFEAFSHKPEDKFRVEAKTVLKPGSVKLSYSFTSDGGMMAGGTMRISVDGKPVAEGRIDKTLLMTAGLGETFDIGRDTAVPVTQYDRGDGVFDGMIRRVDVHLAPTVAAAGTINPKQP